MLNKNITFFAWELYKDEITTKYAKQDPVAFKYKFYSHAASHKTHNIPRTYSP